MPWPVPKVTPQLQQRWVQHARDEYKDMLPDFHVSPEVDGLFQEMLDTCREEKIEVIGLLRMPEGSEFRKLYSPEAARAIDSFLKRLCEKNHTQLIDASQWLSDDCFADSHHLWPKGAERFSLRLWDEVLEKHVYGVRPSQVASVPKIEDGK
jgi:hypothetical protein